MQLIKASVLLLGLMLSFVGCTNHQGIDDVSDTSSADDAYNLSENTFTYEATSNSKDVILLDAKLYTNSEQLELYNLGTDKLMIYLYDSNNLKNAILQIELFESENNLITNLTSAIQYQIGIQCNETTNIKIEISD